MNIFVFDNAENRLRIEEDSILLIKEFAALWDINRNKCKEDKTGKLSLNFANYISVRNDKDEPSYN